MNATGIEWTDFTANPLRYRDAAGRTVWGCVKLSPGCANCYASTLAQRFRRGGRFTQAEMGELTPYLDEKELRTLLMSKKIAGKRVFVGDMTDVFGEWVPVEMIAALFGVMAARPDVTFQVLTKRADRMRRWFEWIAEDREGRMLRAFVEWSDQLPDIDAARLGRALNQAWPLPNVWLGVSAEDQERADERIPLLLATPAAVRFVSAEPLLEAVDLDPLMCERHGQEHVFFGDHGEQPTCTECGSEVGGGNWLDPDYGISWVIVGGESGPGARPCDISWIRSLVQQCREAGVPAFVKQLGGAPTESWCRGADAPLKLRDRKGGDMAEWPEDLRVRELPGGQR